MRRQWKSSVMSKRAVTNLRLYQHFPLLLRSITGGSKNIRTQKTSPSCCDLSLTNSSKDTELRTKKSKQMKATDEGPIWPAHCRGVGNSPETYTIPGNLKNRMQSEQCPTKIKFPLMAGTQYQKKLNVLSGQRNMLQPRESTARQKNKCIAPRNQSS
jgi:hypothetical protein